MTQSTTTLTFETPTPVNKTRLHVATVPMPPSANLREGEENQCTIEVAYIKSGFQGRGYYVVITGKTQQGVFVSHLLFQDPSHYLLVEKASRLSAKKLQELAVSAPRKMQGQIETLLEAARGYYANKGRS